MREKRKTDFCRKIGKKERPRGRCNHRWEDNSKKDLKG
jgi:hypothetical protein